jgi:hypothetical protein
MDPPERSTPSIDVLVKAVGDDRALPDYEWVARLAGCEPTRARSTIEELGRHLDDLASMHAAQLDGGREFYAQICAPFELYALTRLLRPSHIVEAGVSSGVSSTHFLLGLLDNGAGTLHSIDLPTFQAGPVLARGESVVSLPPDRSTGWAVPPELTLGWDLRIGPSEEILPALIESIPTVDLFLHDDLHTPTHLTFELESVRPKLRPGAVVLADNTKWTGKAFDRFARSLDAEVARRRDTDLVGLRVPEGGATPPTKPRARRPSVPRRTPPRRPASKAKRAARRPRPF